MRGTPNRSSRRAVGLLAAAALALGATVAAGAAAGVAGASPAWRARPAPSTQRSAPAPADRSSKRVHRAERLWVSGASPRPGARGVAGSATIVVAFSTPLSPTTPVPTLQPSTPGSWAVHGRDLVFSPSTPFVPLSDVTLTVPAGKRGVVAADGARLSRKLTEHFHVANGTIARLQQLLSLLDYSPLSWAPAGSGIAAADTAAQLRAMYSAPKGTFSWRQGGWPSELTSLWKPGVYNVFTRGLVMEFQADHALIPNGRRTAGLWNDLLQALANGVTNQGGYDYALADQHVPQTLTVWHDGKVVLHAPANTGISASPTPDGNFNVYARYRNQVMRGKNPNGTRYADPVQYVAYFNGGDAVHYLPRANYGIPQSLGCVELDLSDAAAAWPYLAYGTIVSVIG